MSPHPVESITVTLSLTDDEQLSQNDEQLSQSDEPIQTTLAELPPHSAELSVTTSPTTFKDSVTRSSEDNIPIFVSEQEISATIYSVDAEKSDLDQGVASSEDMKAPLTTVKVASVIDDEEFIRRMIEGDWSSRAPNQRVTMKRSAPPPKNLNRRPPPVVNATPPVLEVPPMTTAAELPSAPTPTSSSRATSTGDAPLSGDATPSSSTTPSNSAPPSNPATPHNSVRNSKQTDSKNGLFTSLKKATKRS